jgi:glucose-1-phosphate cytidylyltransferase
MQDGEDLVDQPFKRLIADRRLMAYPHRGFWACMDTVKEVEQLERLYSTGQAAWEVWKRPSNGGAQAQTALDLPGAKVRA